VLTVLRSWWSRHDLPTRAAGVILAGFLLLGVLGLRTFHVRDAATGAIARHSLIELACGGNADRTAPADRLLPPLAPTTDGSRTLLGTDELGRSLALRLSAALATSIGIALSAAVVAMLVGTAWGTLAALSGPRLDSALMRISEATSGVPAMVVITVLVAAFAAYGNAVMFAAMGALYWQGISRVVRARVLRLRSEQYVEASRAIGASAWHRLHVHVLPGVVPTVLTYGALLLPRLVILEGLIAFLGVSARSSPHSFGRIIAGVTSTLTPLSPSWWPVAVPCLVIALFLLALNLVLDSLAADADPRGR
jgi:oligopeptide transport system permease protein